MMTFDDYQTEAIKTAIYPDTMKIIYPSMGVSNEAGEVLGKIKKIIRDKAGVFSDSDKSDIAEELGDTLWYCGVLASDLGIPLSIIAERNLVKLQSRKERGVLGGSGDKR